jgi:hypothetical protein
MSREGEYHHPMAIKRVRKLLKTEGIEDIHRVKERVIA